MTVEQRVKYLQTFSDKIFKLSEATPAENRYQLQETNKKYDKYFENCFELKNSSKFYFYRLLNDETQNSDKSDIYDFISCYRELIVLIGSYLFYALRPQYDVWMGQIEIELDVLAKIKTYIKARNFVLADKKS